MLWSVIEEGLQDCGGVRVTFVRGEDEMKGEPGHGW